MKSARATALVVALAGVAAGPSVMAVPSATTTCLRLTNSTASIYSAVSFIADKKSDLANLPLYKLLAPLDEELPWLSTCVASADILSLGLGLLSDPTAAQCVSMLTSSSSNSSTDTSSLISGSEDFSKTLCPSMNTTIFPCVNNVLVGAIDKLMTSGGDCCADMKKKLPELLGQDLKPFMESLMVRVGDLICSVKTSVDPATGKPKTETCGNALVNTLLNGQDLFDLIQLLQIPNDQACAAMKGQNFTATNGKSYKFFNNIEPVDSCFAPMNSLFTDLGKLPMISQSNISTIFDAGKCLKGESMISMALDEKGLVQGMTLALDRVVADMKLMPAGAVTKVMRSGFEDLKTDFGPMCFHMANSVKDCVYNTTVAYAFSKDAPPPSGKDKGGSSPSNTNAGAKHSAAWPVVLTTMSVVLSLRV